MKEDIKRITSDFVGIALIYGFVSPIIMALIIRPFVKAITGGGEASLGIILLASTILSILLLLLPTMKDLKVSPLETNKKMEDDLTVIDMAALILVFWALSFFLLSGANIISEIKLIGPIMKSMQASVVEIVSNISLPFFIIISLASSITTELIFRGVLLNALRKYGDIFAIIISSILYALISGNSFFIHLNFIGGIFLGVLYVLANDIKVPIIFSLLTSLGDRMHEYMPNLLGKGMYFYGIILIIGSIYLASRKDFKNYILLLKNQYQAEKDNGKGKYAVVFRSEAFIALCLLSILTIGFTIVSQMMK